MPRKEKKYHIIYKTTCRITGNFYVGMHSTNDLNDGYLGSGRRIHRSINKHGREEHVREILAYCDDRKSLGEKEAEIVTERFIKHPQCMNLMEGGHGGFDHLNDDSPENKQRKIDAAFFSNAYQRKKRETDEEFRKKDSERRSKRMTGLLKSGRIKACDWTGRKHSKESIEKMKKAKSGHGAGIKNSQFGTCWIHDDFKSKKIKKDQLDTFLNNGWKQGRKIKFL